MARTFLKILPVYRETVDSSPRIGLLHNKPAWILAVLTVGVETDHLGRAWKSSTNKMTSLETSPFE